MDRVAYYCAIAVVLLTHVYIILQGGMPIEQSVMHAYLNLGAGLVIVYYFYMNRSLV